MSRVLPPGNLSDAGLSAPDGSRPTAAFLTLEVGGGATVESPTLRQIRDALAGIDGKRKPFVILSRADGAFIQVAGSSATGFLIEHRAVSGDHRRTNNQALALSTVNRAFEAFACGKPEPLVGLATQPVSLQTSTGRPRSWSLWVLLIVAVAVYPVAYLWDVLGYDQAFLSLGMALFVGALVFDGLRQGEIVMGGRPIERTAHPNQFGCAVVLYSVVVLMMILTVLFA